ncbi:ferritin family protein [Methanocalculus sp.]|uniref:ferritin family protein n=1 Tax=Methanocalculus sp. TaxID=2004547 RepID=UPI00263A2056|nr:ferritin family protein [Methanocalculus sp.]
MPYKEKGLGEQPIENRRNFMPEFANPFAGNNINRKISHDELIRTIRYSMAAEFEAIQLYMQIADATDNPLAKEVLTDIADEEKVHAGELYRLLMELDPKEGEFYAEGVKEVEEEIEKLKAKK